MEENKFKKVALVGLVILAVVVGGFWLKSKADTPATSLEVTNTVPNTPTGVAEQVASTGTAPTTEGDTVTFQGTASDDNGDQWKLLVCKTTGTSGTDCDGGESDRWCVSSSFANSESQNTCSYTTLNGDAESNAWYAYSCDAVGCSTSNSQGAGDSGSPFNVNHKPLFSASSAPTANPGGTFTFSTTSSDADSDTAQDTISLYVCKADDFTGSACGAGGTWCSVTGVSGVTGNAECDMADVPIQDTTYAAYPYIIDSHGVASAGVAQGVDAPATVNNVAPAVTASSISLNDTDLDGTLTLTVPNADTTGFTTRFTATDANGCANSSEGSEITTSVAKVYRSALEASCTADGNNCYAITSGSCTQDVGACSGASDTAADWTCTFNFNYYADPTDASSVYEAQNWLSAITITDDDSAQSNSGSYTEMETPATQGNELTQFLAYDIPEASIAYSQVAPGGTSSQQSTTLTAQGNTGLNQNVSGSNMCTDYPDCVTNTIDVGQQKYSASTGFDWDSAGSALTTSATLQTLSCLKPTSATNTTKSAYWKLKVPTGKSAGNYTGVNTITGVVSLSGTW